MKTASLSPNLMVEDMHKTIEFYTSILDFTVTMTVPDEKHPVWAMLQNDGVTIMLQQRASFVEEVPNFAQQPIGGSFSLYIHVDDIDTLYKKIQQEKITIIQELHKTFYGAREFSIKDVNGYVLYFAQD
ncbi:MAG: VOC family protein [Candidatus Kerfeldbacteria bacterium]|nr:VOC family protein [Candidatus Kerfeldbacteria bacterium]